MSRRGYFLGSSIPPRDLVYPIMRPDGEKDNRICFEEAEKNAVRTINAHAPQFLVFRHELFYVERGMERIHFKQRFLFRGTLLHRRRQLCSALFEFISQKNPHTRASEARAFARLPDAAGTDVALGTLDAFDALVAHIAEQRRDALERCLIECDRHVPRIARCHRETHCCCRAHARIVSRIGMNAICQ